MVVASPSFWDGGGGGSVGSKSSLSRMACGGMRRRFALAATPISLLEGSCLTRLHPFSMST